MKIRLGLQLDGQRGWHAKNSLNEITVGTSGMLSILEPQLWLIAESVPQSQRVVQYLDCLKHCDHKKRFYHLGLQTDELGTASTLLNWRDQWYLHGWSGKIETPATGRLAKMDVRKNFLTSILTKNLISSISTINFLSLEMKIKVKLSGLTYY